MRLAFLWERKWTIVFHDICFLSCGGCSKALFLPYFPTLGASSSLPRIEVPQNGWGEEWKTLWPNGWFGRKTHYFRKHPYQQLDFFIRPRLPRVIDVPRQVGAFSPILWVELVHVSSVQNPPSWHSMKSWFIGIFTIAYHNPFIILYKWSSKIFKQKQPTGALNTAHVGNLIMDESTSSMFSNDLSYRPHHLGNWFDTSAMKPNEIPLRFLPSTSRIPSNGLAKASSGV